jgi:hypothetical protein
VSAAEQLAKRLSRGIGSFATLRAFLHTKGSGAPSVRFHAIAGAALASAGPSETRTQGRGVAVPRIPGRRGSEGTRVPVMTAAPSPERRRFGRLLQLRTQPRAVSAALGCAAIAIGLLLPTVATAASYEQLATFHNVGAPPKDVAVNESSTGPYAGDVYVAGWGSDAVLRFGPKGEFLESWGWSVVASGPDNVPAGLNHDQVVQSSADAGTYTLTFAGQTTPALPFDATVEEVEAALQGLSSIGAAGGTVTVDREEGPGSPTYLVELGGSLGGAVADDPIELHAANLTRQGSPAFTKVKSTPGFETCFPAKGDICQDGHQEGFATQGTDQLISPEGIAVDPATGNVYVRASRLNGVVGAVREFSPDGTQFLASFGDYSAEPVAADPAALHCLNRGGRGIAVDPANGDVYLADYCASESESRVMIFEPEPESPQRYRHYKYAGLSHDIATGFGPRQIGLDSADNLYFIGDGNSSSEYQSGVYKFAPGEPNHPAWVFQPHGFEFQSLAVDPTSGESFFYEEKHRTFHRLDPDGAELPNSAFKGLLTQDETVGLAFNPNFGYEPGRPLGTLYAIDAHLNAGFIYALPTSHYPTVDSTSFSAVGTASAALSSQIDPHGAETDYAFQYLPEAAYLANHPDTEQQLSVDAEAGAYTLTATTAIGAGRLSAAAGAGNVSFATGAATTTSGSSTLENLTTATGAFAVGQEITAPGLSAAGSALAESGSSTLYHAVASTGAFAVGQTLSGEGIPPGTRILAVNGKELELDTAVTLPPKPTEPTRTFATVAISAAPKIVAVGSGTLELSSPASVSASAVALKAGSPTTVEALTTATGAFAPGQRISATGIPAATGTGNLTVGSPQVSAVTGSFAVGEVVSGAGIPARTTIKALGPGTLELSAPAQATATAVPLTAFTVIIAVNEKEHTLTLSTPATAPGEAIALSAASNTLTAVSASLASFHLGDVISGVGIPPATTVTGVSIHGDLLELSAYPTSSGPTALTATEQTAPISFDAPGAGEASLQSALNALPGLQVSVAGGPGGPGAANPYSILFHGALSDTDVAPLQADSSALSGAGAAATVSVSNHGGNGFAGAVEVPSGGADLGTGQEDLTAAAFPSGLDPDTTYRFRALASSHCNPAEEAELCTAAGLAAAFHTYPAASGLPDQRAYELVSPPQKNGGEVYPLDPRSGCNELCKPGWSSTPMPKQLAPDGESLVYEGTPFCASGVSSELCPNGAAIAENEYLATRTESGWRSHDLSPAGAEKSSGVNGYKGFSTALSAGVIFQRPSTLSPQAPPGYDNLYSQQTSEPGAFQPLLTSQPPNRSASEFRLTYAGASADLSHLVFTANDALTAAEPGIAPPAPEVTAAERNLYESGPAGLRLINVAPGNSAALSGATFAAISADGSHVFFTSAGHLYVRIEARETLEIKDPGSFLATVPDASMLLLDDGCLYSLASESCQAELTNGQGGFKGILAATEALSSVYFVDTAVLSGEQENEAGATAQAGKNNLYLYREGSTTFIAIQAPTFAQASPDGRYLAYHSDTGVSEYDSASGRLTCASCNPSLATPLGGSSLPVHADSNGVLPQPHDILNDGRLFFDSADVLSPQDTNGSVEDVYEYEPKGTGTCQLESQNGGCLSLISSGHGSSDSNFFDASPSGRDVFFTTRERLIPADTDDLFDLYDARENGGGFPHEETAQTECQGEACQPPPVVPNDATPASSTFHGAGNLEEAPAPCKKGFAKKRGHCVKKSHKRHKRHHTRHANANGRAGR